MVLVAAGMAVSVGLDRETLVVAAAGMDLEVRKVLYSASYQFLEPAEKGIGRAVVPAQIHKEDTEAEMSHVVVVGSVGAEEGPGNWLAAAQCKSFLRRRDC